MDKATKQKIEELEGRIRALEARPPTQIHYHYGAPQAYPCPQPLLPIMQPWIAPQPIWAYRGIGAAMGGCAPAPQTITYTGVAQ